MTPSDSKTEATEEKKKPFATIQLTERDKVNLYNQKFMKDHQKKMQEWFDTHKNKNFPIVKESDGRYRWLTRKERRIIEAYERKTGKAALVRKENE